MNTYIESTTKGTKFLCYCEDGTVKSSLAVGKGYHEVKCECGRRFLMSYNGTAWRIIGDTDLTVLSSG